MWPMARGGLAYPHFTPLSCVPKTHHVEPIIVAEHIMWPHTLGSLNIPLPCLGQTPSCLAHLLNCSLSSHSHLSPSVKPPGILSLLRMPHVPPAHPLSHVNGSSLWANLLPSLDKKHHPEGKEAPCHSESLVVVQDMAQSRDLIIACWMKVQCCYL